MVRENKFMFGEGLHLSQMVYNQADGLWILRGPVCDIEVTMAMCKCVVDHHQHHTMLMYVGLT